MLTEKDYCDYDTCVALKELGFDYNVDWYIYSPSYEKEGQEGCWLCWGIPPMISEEQEQEYIPRVSLYEAQKWLREEKNIDISVTISFEYFATIREFVFWREEYSWKTPPIYPKGAKTYEGALSEGIRKAVKILKEK